MAFRPVRRLLAGLFLVASTALALTALAGSADAAPAKPGGGFPPATTLGLFTNTVDEPGAGVHTCRSNTCTALEVNAVDTPVRDFCYRDDGQLLGGTRSWHLLFNPASTVAGWTNREWLDYSQAQNCTEANSVYPTAGAALPGTGIHSCRSNTCPALGFANGHSVVVLCYRGGQTLAGNPWWDLVYDRTTGVAGWTNEHWLTRGTNAGC